MLNLITDHCFPIQRQDGTVENIAIWQITDNLANNPITAFRAPRADFDAALVQFAIGLLQTALMPESLQAWQKIFRKAPDPDSLKEAFLPFAPHFNLMGEGPRFMQDLELQGLVPNKDIGGLLIDAPGGNTLKNNTDHFIKRGKVEKLSPMATAMALFCLQTNAPSGGVGHRTSLRGGGPLTTLIQRKTLWETLWLAVLDKTQFPRSYGEWDNRKPEEFLPWLKPTITSEKNAVITPVNHHPFTVYWAMPRRIRLAEPIMEPGVCDLSGEQGACFFTGYETKNYGNNYERWVHPLSPHYLDKTGQLLPVHGQSEVVAYHQWLGLAFREGGKNTREPAAIIQSFRDRVGPAAHDGNSEGNMPRIWVFGYDMDNAKARSWVDRTMPVIFGGSKGLGPEGEIHRVNYETAVKDLIHAALFTVAILSKQYKAGITREGVKVKGDVSFVDARFWESTEPRFLTLIERLANHPEEGSEVREQWLKDLQKAALDLFDKLTEIRPLEVIDPERTVTARTNLARFTSPSGKKFRAQVGLDPIIKATPTGGKS